MLTVVPVETVAGKAWDDRDRLERKNDADREPMDSRYDPRYSLRADVSPLSNSRWSMRGGRDYVDFSWRTAVTRAVAQVYFLIL